MALKHCRKFNRLSRVHEKVTVDSEFTFAKNKKNSKKGVVAYVMWPTFQFWDPLIYPGRLKIQTSNFACRLIVSNMNQNNEKLAKKAWSRSRMTYFLNFVTPKISLEQLKIQSSNFACWLKVRDTKPKNDKKLTSRWDNERELLKRTKTNS